MNTLEYVFGFALLAVVVGGFGVSAAALRTALVGAWTGAPATLATIVLGLSVAVVGAEALGMVGLLSTPGLLAVAVLPAIALTRWKARRAASAEPAEVPVGRIALWIAVAASLLTAVHWAGPVLKSLDVGIYRQDSLWYHLPTAAWFAQTGSTWGLLLTDPLKLTVWFYPANSELLHSIGMVVLGNDLLSPLLNYGWMGVALLAAWCIGRPSGLAAVTLLGAILVVNSDMMLVQAGNAPSDIAALACLLAAIAALMSDRRPGALAVAALAAGLAIGAKTTMLVPVAVIAVGMLAEERAGLGRRAAVWGGGLLLTGGFWYLRNLVHSGNPLPWIGAGPLPSPHQENLYPRPAHSVAEYLADTHAWTHFFLPGLGETLGPLWPLVVFGAFAGVILGLRRGQPRLIRVLALAAIATLASYIFIPISASGFDGAPSGFASNLRYAGAFFAIGLTILPLSETRETARRVILPAYAAIAAAAAIGSTEWVQPQLLTALAIGGVTVLLPLWAMGRPGRRRAMVFAGVALVALAGGYAQQRQYFEDRFQPELAPPLDNPGFRATSQWKSIQAWALAQHGIKIGIVGTPAAFGQYVFYGDDLSNEVRYIGERRPHGGYGPITSCARWRGRILQGEFDAIVVTPEDPGATEIPPQIEWTALGGAGTPAVPALPGAVFLVSGPADPSDCGGAHGYPGRAGPDSSGRGQAPRIFEFDR